MHKLLGIELDEDYNIYDILQLSRIDGLTKTQAAKLAVLRDVISEYNTTVPVECYRCYTCTQSSIRRSDSKFCRYKSLTQCGKVLDITVIDHVILSDSCYYSFNDESKNAYDQDLLKQLHA